MIEISQVHDLPANSFMIYLRTFLRPSYDAETKSCLLFLKRNGEFHAPDRIIRIRKPPPKPGLSGGVSQWGVRLGGGSFGKLGDVTGGGFHVLEWGALSGRWTAAPRREIVHIVPTHRLPSPDRGRGCGILTPRPLIVSISPTSIHDILIMSPTEIMVCIWITITVSR